MRSESFGFGGDRKLFGAAENFGALIGSTFVTKPKTRKQAFAESSRAIDDKENDSLAESRGQLCDHLASDSLI